MDLVTTWRGRDEITGLDEMVELEAKYATSD
jgi:hypothetical protein